MSIQNPRSPGAAHPLWSRRLVAAVALSILVVLAAGTLAARSLAIWSERSDWLSHTAQVRLQLARTLQSLTDIETAARGYALTGNVLFLDPYEAAANSLDPGLQQLTDLVADNPIQRSSALRLDELAHQRAGHARQVIERARAGDFEGARGLVAGGAGREAMDAIRAIIAQMQSEQARLLSTRTVSDAQARRLAELAFWSMGALAILLLALVAYVSARDGQRLLQSEERFRAAVDAVEGVLWTNSAAGEMHGAQPGWSALTGQSIDEYQGFGWANAVHPEDAQPTIDAWLAAVHERRPFHFEHRVRRRDGEWRRFSIRAIPVLTQSATIHEWVGLHTDITDQRQREEALKASEARFRAVQETSIDGFMVLESVRNVDGHIVDFRWIHANEAAERIVGKPRSWFIGRNLLQEMPGNREEGMFDAYVRVVETGEPWAHEVAYQHENMNVYLRLVAARSGDGFAVTFADLSERRRIEEQVKEREAALREADLRKDVFLATLSHELRNPLAPIRTAARILEMPNLKREALERSQIIIARQVKHMASLLDDLLDVSRITRGEFLLKKEYVNLQASLTEALDSAQTLIDSKQHKLILEWPQHPVEIEVDPVRLVQVASNLLTNAAKYTEAGGQITFGARLEAQGLQIYVRDTGIGLAPDSLHKVFEMFAQVSRDTQRTEGGLGIGLALVKGLVELHGGRVEARSAGLGKGSEFIVFLPASRVAPRRPQGQSTEQRDSRPENSHLRVLIADDNRDGAESLAMLLQLRNCETYIAYSGPAALEALRQQRPSVAILDIGMPGMNGYEVARAIRREAWGSRITLIAVTGWGQEEDKRAALIAGFDHHLTKPVDPDELQSMLQQQNRNSS